ncbi:MAG: glutamate--cysteine ligase [Actinomycetes bacterium]
MDTTFRGSETGTLGVEWELQLVDVESRELCNDAAAVLDALPPPPAGTPPTVKHELMQHTVEIVSGVCRSVAEVKADLAGTVAMVREVVESRGLTLACAGSHPISDWRTATIAPGERYAELLERCQWPVRRIQTFGVHVHVGVGTGDLAVAVVNGLTAYIPHVLALTASSPYWSGEDTGLASSRAIVFGVLPTAGLPMPVADWAGFERYVNAMERAGTISDIKDVWWDIRPQPALGTVENRVSDGIPTLREVGMVAALTQCLVDEMTERAAAGDPPERPAPWVVRENKWRAGRYGLDTDVLVDDEGATRPLREDLTRLVERLTPRAGRLGCAEDLATVTDVLLHGASYQRQRAVVEKGGGLEDVVDLLTGEMRRDQIA